MTQETTLRREARKRHFNILFNSLTSPNRSKPMAPDEADEEIGQMFFLSGATVRQIRLDDKYGQRNQYKEKR